MSQALMFRIAGNYFSNIIISFINIIKLISFSEVNSDKRGYCD